MDNDKGIGEPLKENLSFKKGKNYFLGIGINDYSSGLSPLYNAVRDVERVGQILKEKYDFDILHILTNAQATRSEILKQLRALQSLSEDDSLLIYYSGHGHLAPEDGYWIPVNANIEDIDHYIPNAQLRGLIRAIPTRHTLLIADSCYSGSFFPESETKNMRGAADELEKYRSRWAFCSGRYDQKVSDGTAGTHSPFAEALITELERNNRPKVYIQELAIPVINRTAGKYRQTPKANLIFDCGDDGGQFVFSLKDNEAEEWQATLNENSIAGFEKFKYKYPLSNFRSEANKRWAILKKEEAEKAHLAEWERTKRTNTAKAYLNFWQNNPKSPFRQEARELMGKAEDDEEWAMTRKTPAGVLDYLDKFPSGLHKDDADAILNPLEPESLHVKAFYDEIKDYFNEKTIEIQNITDSQKTMDETTQPSIVKLSSKVEPKPLTLKQEVLKRKLEKKYEDIDKPIFIFPKYKMLITIGGFLVVAFVIWKMSSGLETTPFKDPFEGQMLTVEGGTFQMGCTNEQGNDCYPDEKPPHTVTLDYFQIGKYEVTQAQWQKVMGYNPSDFKKCDECPVDSITWNDTKIFIQKLNKETRKSYRLPTETEWEFAARGGVKSMKFKYSGSNSLENVAWYDKNSNNKTHIVGQKQPNELGIYDMSGNVWEWCSSKSVDYSNNIVMDSMDFVTRGGGWRNIWQYCRVTNRGKSPSIYKSRNVGLRLAMSIE